ncbi:MAG: hypothetical protein ACFFG0_07480 [Candidatus Thorarchaeota archaeon]
MGITRNSFRILILLYRLKKEKPSNLIQISKIARRTVFDNLNYLEEKGFIDKDVRIQTHYYFLTDIGLNIVKRAIQMTPQERDRFLRTI